MSVEEKLIIEAILFHFHFFGDSFLLTSMTVFSFIVVISVKLRCKSLEHHEVADDCFQYISECAQIQVDNA